INGRESKLCVKNFLFFLTFTFANFGWINKVSIMKRFIFLSFGLITLITFSSCQDDTLLPVYHTVSVSSNTPSEVTLKVGESVFLNDELLVTFSGIGADSRCQIDLMCFWAGDAEVKLKLTKGSLQKEVVLHTGLTPTAIVFDGYEIALKNVLPARKSTEDIKPEQYLIELRINYNVNAETKQVYFIDGNSDWVVKKDMIAVNSASLEKDMLALSVSYSGGCRDHIIDLYAYTGILKSNPPQMNLVLSHNANGDMCEAYVTRTINFDLSKIKEYLGGQVGYTGTVILNINGTDGKPIKQSPVSYKY
ncbi:MAG: hypothetical protein A3J88_05960, partial [Melioribacter sp. RIFOXYB12_FULL_38_5]